MLPLFKSHYSVGRSILTLEKPGSSHPEESDSIFDICLEGNLDKLCLVEDQIGGCIQAQENCAKLNIKLMYGIRFNVVPDINDKSEESRGKESKLIVFTSSADTYKNLFSIYTTSYRDGFYYYPRIDVESIKKYWHKDLILAVPFYDSYIYGNYMQSNIPVPEISFADPIFFIEKNGLPFDPLIEATVKQNAGSSEVIMAKSIYYKTKKDFLAYQIFRTISERSSFEKPEMEHMSSDKFCFEEVKNA